MPDLFGIARPAGVAVVYMAFWKSSVHKASSVLFCVFIGEVRVRILQACYYSFAQEGGVFGQGLSEKKSYLTGYTCSVNLALVDIVYFCFFNAFFLYIGINRFFIHPHSLPVLL